MTKDYPDLTPSQVPLTDAQRRLIMVLVKENGWSDTERHEFTEAICGQPSVAAMTMAEAGRVIDALNGYRFGLQIQMNRPGT